MIVTQIVAAMRSPKFVFLGLGRLAERTRASMLNAIGGPMDPHQVLAELRRQVAPDVSQEDALEFLLELSTDSVAGDLKNLNESAAAMAPHIAAIVADLQRTGMATSQTIAACLL